MTRRSRTLLTWSPRILGILVVVFLGLFALDAFADRESFAQALPAFLVHAAPALFLLAIVALSWRWEWIGGAIFTAMAVLYAITTARRIDWVLTISGPLLAVGVLYLVSWRHHKRLRARA